MEERGAKRGFPHEAFIDSCLYTNFNWGANFYGLPRELKGCWQYVLSKDKRHRIVGTHLLFFTNSDDDDGIGETSRYYVNVLADSYAQGDDEIDFFVKYLRRAKNNTQAVCVHNDQTDLSADGVKKILDAVSDSHLKIFELSSGFRDPETDDRRAIAIAEGFADVLRNNNSLLALSLRGNAIGNNGVTTLCESLKENITLRALHLDENDIDTEGLTELFESCLSSHPMLEDVRIGGNYFGRNQDQHAVEFFGRILKKSRVLKSLSINCSNVGPMGCAFIGLGLQTNATLLRLDLRSNKIGNHGAKSLATGLKRNNALKELHIDRNDIRDEGAAALALMLETNGCLDSLSMCFNKIGADGGDALVHCLRYHNHTLQTLRTKFRQMKLPSHEQDNERLSNAHASKIDGLTLINRRAKADRCSKAVVGRWKRGSYPDDPFILDELYLFIVLDPTIVSRW